jgi:hypothetical protein
MAADDKWMYLFSQSAGAFSPVGEIAAYHLENGERSQIYKFPAFFATAMAVSPDQKNLAVGTSKGVVLLLPINR